MGSRVHFSRSGHGAVAAAYAACDALVFPVTWHEPWGLVPLEAMASGRPVLASRAGGGPAEYLEEGVNCLQFAPGDAAGLALALRRLAGEAALRTALVAGGRETAARFPESAFHAALVGELERAIAERAAAVSERPRVAVVMPFAGDDGGVASRAGGPRAAEHRPGDELVLADNRGRSEVLEGTIRHLAAAGVRTAGWARNRGAEATGGEWLVFLDADTRPAPDLLDRYFIAPRRRGRRSSPAPSPMCPAGDGGRRATAPAAARCHTG